MQVNKIKQYDGDTRIEANGEIVGWVRKHTGVSFTAFRNVDDGRPVRSRHVSHERAVACVVEGA